MPSSTTTNPKLPREAVHNSNRKDFQLLRSLPLTAIMTTTPHNRVPPLPPQPLRAEDLAPGKCVVCHWTMTKTMLTLVSLVLFLAEREGRGFSGGNIKGGGSWKWVVKALYTKAAITIIRGEAVLTTVSMPKLQGLFPPI